MTDREQTFPSWRWHLRVHLWFAWNRLRYYWPQAKCRKRAGERLREDYAKLGEDWKPSRHWLHAALVEAQGNPERAAVHRQPRRTQVLPRAAEVTARLRILEEYADTTWLATGLGERIAHHLQLTALLREQGKTAEAAELDRRFDARLAWEMS